MPSLILPPRPRLGRGFLLEEDAGATRLRDRLRGWGGRIRTSAFRILSELCSLNFHMIEADLMAPHLLSSALLRDGLVR